MQWLSSWHGWLLMSLVLLVSLLVLLLKLLQFMKQSRPLTSQCGPQKIKITSGLTRESHTSPGQVHRMVDPPVCPPSSLGRLHRFLGRLRRFLGSHRVLKTAGLLPLLAGLHLLVGAVV